MKYEGVVYRPPSEASSLIVQVTIGCAHNTCTFCNMYKSKDFRVRSMEEIMNDLQGAADHYGSYVRKVFLADGDALVMKTEDLLTILRAIKTLFPQAGRVASYGTAQDILRKSEEELRQLSEAGLGIIYVGAESGDDEILRYIHKGVTAEEVIAAGQKLKRCGIQTSVTLISGLGGRGKVEEHALSCARLVSAMNPDYASFLTLRLYEGTPMYDDVIEGRFERITADEIADEMKVFLDHVDSPGTVFRTNHASNYVILAGNLNDDIPEMLETLNEAKKNHHYRRMRETGDL
ncbi:MAG: radical SAM protein [Clostridium sp.]